MREIKFRAWDKKEKQMAEVQSINFRRHEIEVTPVGKESVESYVCRDFELMQSTEMMDLNNQKIYEGDIVEFQDSQFHVEGYCYTNFINRGAVEYESGTFYFKNLKGYSMDDFLDDFTDENYWDCVVVGNIYENPELIERK